MPWDYTAVDGAQPYGGDTTYRLGIGWLDQGGLIEDWGCGTAYAAQFVRNSLYRGVDSAPGHRGNVTADLRVYASPGATGVFLRHVLEHNHGWAAILDNATGTASHRLCVVLFTPWQDHTRVLSETLPGVPDIGFSRHEIYSHLTGWDCREETHTTFSQFGQETTIYAQRVAP